MSHIISFPGLHLGPFTLDPTAFTVFGLEVKWYGVIITCGIVLAFLYVLLRARYENIKSDDVFDYAIFILIFSIIGARLYYVVFSGIEYKTFFDVINIRQGGLAIYGGILAGAATTFIVSKVKKIDARKFFDMLAPAVMLGQIIGRWGNFVNAEAYGSETDLPWRMTIESFQSSVSVHPTFLYESLWNLVGFIGINLFYKKKKYNGQIALLYITWYGLGRSMIEGLRTDSLYWGPFRVSQMLGAAAFLCGLTALIVCGIVSRKHRTSAAEISVETPPAQTTKSESTEAQTNNPENAETTTEKGETEDHGKDH